MLELNNKESVTTVIGLCNLHDRCYFWDRPQSSLERLSVGGMLELSLTGYSGEGRVDKQSLPERSRRKVTELINSSLSSRSRTLITHTSCVEKGRSDDCKPETGGFSSQLILEVYPQRYRFKFTSSSNYGSLKYDLYVKWRICASHP